MREGRGGGRAINKGRVIMEIEWNKMSPRENPQRHLVVIVTIIAKTI